MQKIDEIAQLVYRSLVAFADALSRLATALPLSTARSGRSLHALLRVNTAQDHR